MTGISATVLTPEQRAAFRDAGYILCRGFVDAEARARYDARFVELANGRAPLPDGMIAMRDVMVVKGAVEPPTALHGINKILNFETDPVLFDYAQDARVLDVARELVDASPDSPLYVISTNVFNKPPGVDGRHPLHQDLRYFRLRPPEGIVASWTALKPCTRQTGCLAVVPGSHLGGLRPHGDPDWDYVNHAFYGVDGIDRARRVHVEMQPGDTLFFHPLLVHGSGRNRSEGFRRAISAHFASPHCTTDGRDWKTGPHVRAVGGAP